MAGKIKHGGLCSTCNNAPDCTFSQDPDNPVVHCEEFDSGKALPMRATVEARSPAPLSYEARGSDSVRFSGLCSDCEDREACMFPKPEGGIWHCEEYR